MQLQSLWLTNRGLLDKMNDLEYKYKEKEIIESLFGGTRNMIKIMLKHKNNLSYIQQNELLKVLKKSIPKQNLDVNHESDDENIPVTLTSLNENCLSYIFIFLHHDERIKFLATCRIICIASVKKNSHPNSDILRFPLNKSYHFIQKICAVKNINTDENSLSKLIHESTLLCSWIKNDVCIEHINDYYKQRMEYKILQSIAKSGLLSIFSNLLINKFVINNHMQLIENILFLFELYSRYTGLTLPIINVNIIENLAFLLQTIMHKDDVLIQTQIVPYIVTIVNILYFNDDNPFQSSIWEQVLESKVIESVITLSGQVWTKNTKNLSWITRAMYLIREWIFHCRHSSDSTDYDNIILNNIIQPFMNKISDLIDVARDRKWIYQLLSKGDDIVIKCSLKFSISEIVKLSAPNDANPSITLLGKYNSSNNINPEQQLCVELDDIYCSESFYQDMIETFESLCNLILAVSWYVTDAKLNESVTNGIKRILQVSQNQFFPVSNIDSLIFLLKSNWDFFMEFIANEIQREFTRGTKSLHRLMYVANNYGKLDALCKMPWFKQAFYDTSHVPDECDEGIFTVLLKNFCTDYESFQQMEQILERLDFSNYEYVDYFVNENGIYYLFQMIITPMKTYSGVYIHITRSCASVLSDLFVYLSHDCIRKEMLKLLDGNTANGDTRVDLLQVAYWMILEDILKKNRNNAKHIKAVLQEMDWVIHEWLPDLSQSQIKVLIQQIISDTVREILHELQSRDFADNQISTLLDNILSSI